MTYKFLKKQLIVFTLLMCVPHLSFAMEDSPAGGGGSGGTSLRTPHLITLGEDALELKLSDAAGERHSPFERLRVEEQRLINPFIRARIQDYLTFEANPNLYLLRSRTGTPLNIFIFGTVHPLPIEILPPHTKRVIELIASTPNCRLISELGEGYDENEEERGRKILAHPKAFWNREAQIQRDMAKFEELYGYIYADSSESWEKRKREKRLELTSKYGSWSSKLDPAVRKMLAEDLPEEVKLDDINPTFVLTCMRSGEEEEKLAKRAAYLDLDDEIGNVFKGRGISSVALDTNVLRGMGDIERELSYQPEDCLLFDYYLEQINTLGHKAISLEEELGVSLPEKRHLKDVPFLHSFVSSFLAGDFLPIVENPSLRLRNNHWFQNTIGPLIEGRMREAHSASPRPPFAPVFIMYGAAHNEGRTGMLNQAKKRWGSELEFWKLTRKGFQQVEGKPYLASGE